MINSLHREWWKEFFYAGCDCCQRGDANTSLHFFCFSLQSGHSCDGGGKYCIILGVEPSIIIGDLDSIHPDELPAYRAKGIELIQYPARKDETDLELALHYALNRGIEDIVILGGLGARWDMSIANILLLAHPGFEQLNIRLIDGSQELMLMRHGAKLTLPAVKGDTVSLIPLAGDALGITTHGLEYPLNDGDLRFGTSRGVSNVAMLEPVEILLQGGLLLCIITHTFG
jgi:thiamine pyrophosphokinase